MREIEGKLGYCFNDRALLSSALTHPSLSGKNTRGGAANAYERLEFLGDRVLGLVIAEWLYKLFPNSAEGDLAKRHASLVSHDALERVSEQTGIAQALRVTSASGNGAKRQNIAVLSDAVESVIGAMYLDGGLDAARRFIETFWESVVHVDAAPVDSKSVLQEWAQGKGLPLPVYSVVDKTGPAHAPVFQIKVEVKGFAPVVCEGNSKRDAEKAAAQSLFEDIMKKG